MQSQLDQPVLKISRTRFDVPADRYFSLDVFRGATVALMILVNNPGTWSGIFDPLEHASWHGLTPTDLVFPFFLFAVGNSMAFVLPRLRDQGDDAFWKKVIKRTLLIFLIGTFINWFPFVHRVDDQLIFRGWEWITPGGEIAGIRVMGTLQRIALCYFFAAITVYYMKPAMAGVFGFGILLLYWIWCLLMNPSDPYSFTGWFGREVDLNVFGAAHVYRGDGIPFENEGLVSTIPAIVQVIFGFIVGDHIRKNGIRIPKVPGAVRRATVHGKTLWVLLAWAAVLVLAGSLWSLEFPINKKIQSSSFVIVTTGLAILVLSSVIYFVEIKHQRGWWTKFFDVFGKNALFIYALSELLPRFVRLIRIPFSDENGKQLFTNPFSWFYQNVCAEIPGRTEIGSLVYAICIVFLYWAIGYWMHKKKIYIRV
jgi:predicted acyltransferase